MALKFSATHPELGLFKKIRMKRHYSVFYGLALVSLLLFAGCTSIISDPASMATGATTALPVPFATASVLPQDTEEEEKEVWSGLFEAGAAFTGGNTKSRETDAKVEVKADWEGERFSAYVRSEWGESIDDVGEMERHRNRQTAGAKYEYDFSERFYVYANQDFEKDEFQDLRLRSTTTVGAGYKVLDEEKHKLSTEAGVGYETSDYYDDENRDNSVGRLAEAYDWLISEQWTFLQTFELISNLEEIDDDVRTTTTAELRNQLTENLFLSFGVEHRYNGEPAVDDMGDRKKRQDWLATIKVGWTF